jgi:tetratricopeptide (TPR) repeat protein
LASIKLNYINVAINHLLTAVDISPRDYVSHTALAGIMLERSQYDLAAKHIDYALESNPNYAEALKMRQYLQGYYSNNGGSE